MWHKKLTRLNPLGGGFKKKVGLQGGCTSWGVLESALQYKKSPCVTA